MYALQELNFLVLQCRALADNYWQVNLIEIGDVLEFGGRRIELGAGGAGASNRVNVLHTKNLDVNSEGLIVDMTYFDSGNVL